ncbi:putative ABC transport system ATP-binding protein [Malonomonas rubra DSM 5091]|uniref:Putative ABC transport system ATP-binding protein n=1 Tax=Malonomonas rubra DSM 5091 TaxID=1122189 RepID=A0A1M6H7D3_MALRU|nr:ABC transporter ATP-binding protein [Malonomonas rubra]SHJ18076.1 putative ABC transport system ATP-binding protein [Malonomonas rubra DSM 5091]
MPTLIETKDLCKIYNRHKPDELQALSDVAFSIDQGQVAVLKGPSGSGKTSLLSLIGCMARPTSGSIRLADKDVAKLPERFLAELRRDLFGFIFQQFNLMRELSLFDNILLPLYPTEISGKEMKSRADEILRQLELGDRKQQKVKQLSGGEQQRVAIARALINQPEIIIADEPTAHLDRALTEELLTILARLKQNGKTIIIATHDPAIYQQQELIDRSYLMHDGNLLEVERL